VHPLAGIIAAFARAVSGVQVLVRCFSETAQQRIICESHEPSRFCGAVVGAACRRARPDAAGGGKGLLESGVKAYLAQNFFAPY